MIFNIKKSKKSFFWILLVLLLGVWGITSVISYIILPTQNPEPKGQLPAFLSAESQAILKKSCFDCHSNQAVFPFYSYLPGVNILIASHVKEGREKVNFSTWDIQDTKQIIDDFEESLETINKAEMPLKDYLFLHPQAEVTKSEYLTLKADFDKLLQNPQANQESDTEMSQMGETESKNSENKDDDEEDDD